MSATRNGKKVEMTTNLADVIRRQTIVINDATTQLLYRRGALMGQDPDRRRSLFSDCGYPQTVTIDEYKEMFDREGVAARVVSIYPDECWAVDPDVYETEEEEDTPFESTWKDLCDDGENNILSYLHRVDVMSGIGHYGVLLIGLDDGKDFSLPVDGINERGEAVPRTRDHKLIYLRAFDEKSVRIASYQADKNNPRFGRPLLYQITFADMAEVSEGNNGEILQMTRDVHWSRVIHVADNRQGSETVGTPRQKNVFNKLMDLQKNLGGSAEMFYKGGFPGLSVELDPRVLETLNVTVNMDSIHAEMYKYMNSLQRYISVIGMNVKSLAPQIVSPEGHIRVQMESIAVAIKSPLRIFMGSEQAQLASGQDVRTWNRRLRQRQTRYLTPYLLRPTVDRFIAFGILPEPTAGKYLTSWPDVNMPTDDEQSKIADRRAASLMKYMQSGAWQAMQPSDFYRFIIGLTPEQIKVVMRKLKLKPEVDFIEAITRDPQALTKKAGDSGSKGSSPSKPPTGGVVT